MQGHNQGTGRKRPLQKELNVDAKYPPFSTPMSHENIRKV